MSVLSFFLSIFFYRDFDTRKKETQRVSRMNASIWNGYRRRNKSKRKLKHSILHYKQCYCNFFKTTQNEVATACLHPHHRRSAIHGLIVKSSKSDCLKSAGRIRCASSKIGIGLRSRFLVLNKRIAPSGTRVTSSREFRTNPSSRL